MARRAQFIIADGTTTYPSITVDGNYALSNVLLGGWQGGIGTVFVVGTFGGGTAKLQIQAPDGATWVDIGAGASFTANGAVNFTAPAGPLRINVAGSTAATLKAFIVGVPANIGG